MQTELQAKQSQKPTLTFKKLKLKNVHILDKGKKHVHNQKTRIFHLKKDDRKQENQISKYTFATKQKYSFKQQKEGQGGKARAENGARGGWGGRPGRDANYNSKPLESYKQGNGTSEKTTLSTRKRWNRRRRRVSDTVRPFGRLRHHPGEMTMAHLEQGSGDTKKSVIFKLKEERL